MKILSLIYGFIIYLRNRLYDYKIKKSEKVEGVEIICIGNIVAGGSGKTPAVQYMVKKYINENKKVGILSRGYKGKREKDPFLVRDFNKIYGTPYESGDEAYLHAISLNVPVVVSKNRVEGAKYLRDVCKVDVIIMDDGFQHRKLIKNKNIILIDATNPFGNFEYLPKGRLRESLNEIKRADEIIISKSNYVDKITLENIKNNLKKYNKPILIGLFEEDYFYNMEKEKINLNKIENKNILIFSSIANPEIFYNTVKKLNPKSIEQIKFEDHHIYNNEEILEIEKKGKNFDYIVTTEKDIVKINKKIENLIVLKMEFKIKKEI